MKKSFLILLLVIHATGFAQVNQRVPAELQKLTNLAITNFPKMHSLDELVKISSLKSDMNSAGYLPIVNIDASYMYLNPTSSVAFPVAPGVVKSFQMNPADNYSAGLSVVQPLLDFKTLANMSRAKSDITVSEATRESYRSQLAYQIAQIYYGVIFLNKSIAVQKLQLNLVSSYLDITKAKLKSGDALKYDLVTSQVRYTTIENIATELQTQLRKQYNLLSMLTGEPPNNAISDTTLSGFSYDVVRDSILQAALERNDDIILAQNKIQYAEKDVSAAKAFYLPSLNLIASAGYKDGFAPKIFDIKFNYNYGVSLNVPVLPASRPGIQTELAETGLASSKDELNYQKSMITKDVRNALDEIAKNESKLGTMDTLLQQAGMAVELATGRYKEGVITNVELLSAETNYQDALLSKLQTEYNLLISKLELCRLSGMRWW
jgi:outer membrane protein TolC